MRLKSKLLGRLGVLAVVCAGGVCAAAAPAASAAVTEVPCTSITGSGSSLQNLAQTEVFGPGFTSGGGWKTAIEETKCEGEPSVTYKATSSGKGLACWGSASGSFNTADCGNGSTVDDFVGTDVGPEGNVEGATEGTVKEGTQIYNMNKAGGSNGVVTVPIAQSAIAVMVSLPTSCTSLENATKPAQIKNTELVEEWDKDTVSFTKLISNVGVKSCEVTPVLQARATPSGTTAGFKRYLADLNSAFGKYVENAEKAESQEEWPLFGKMGWNETGNNTGGELAKTVYNTPGTVGYADLADARKAGFAAGNVPVEHEVAGKKYYSFIVEISNGGEEEKAGSSKFESPEGDATSSAASDCDRASYPEPAKVGVNIDWSRAKQQNNTKGEGGYPICTLTYDVGWQHYEKVSAYGSNAGKIANTVVGYLRWILHEGETSSSLTSDHYAPLTTNVRTRAEAGVKEIGH